MTKKIFNLAIIGGGPAGVALLVRAARIGRLEQLLGANKATSFGTSERGVIIFDDREEASFGAGKLGSYLINSNTSGTQFVSTVVDDKPENDPPEFATGTPLERLRGSEVGKQLRESGQDVVPLELVGDFLSEIGAVFLKEIRSKYSESSECWSRTRVTRIQRLENGLTRIQATHRDTSGALGEIEVLSRAVVLATGGVQNMSHIDAAFASKVLSSDYVLTEEGVREVKMRLSRAAGSNKSKVCIVGGSHSAFSASWILLHRVNGAMMVAASNPGAKERGQIRPACLPEPAQDVNSQEEGQRRPGSTTSANLLKANEEAGTNKGILKFGTKDITILHRHAVQLYYPSKREAEADGYKDGIVSKTGSVNEYGGLRGDAKKLYRDIRHARELRVRLLQMKPSSAGSEGGKSTKYLQNKVFEEASLIISSCGYSTAGIPIVDEQERPLKLATTSNGMVEVSPQAALIFETEDGSELEAKSLFGAGLGYGMKPSVIETDGSQERRADGVKVYQYRTATIILAALFGKEVYGYGASSWDERIDRQRAKEASQDPPGSPKRSGDRPKSPSRVKTAGLASADHSRSSPSPKYQQEGHRDSPSHSSLKGKGISNQQSGRVTSQSRSHEVPRKQRRRAKEDSCRQDMKAEINPSPSGVVVLGTPALVNAAP